ncbi:MAG: DNA recombination protein RmuC [Planctomycetota bacterium]
MEWFILGFVLGAIIGAAVAVVVSIVRARAAQRQMRETFASLASEALDANTRRLTESTGAELESKKALIDQSVKAMNERLEQVRQYLQKVEAERKQDLGRLSGSVQSLSQTTGELHKMLASTQRRGAWGERMAEDVLRLAGLQEGVNYVKQAAAQAEQGRPDFTFFLPNDLTANMDVKFPLEHYKSYLDAEDDATRQQQLNRLIQAVRNQIKGFSNRQYIDTKGGTVPYVIMFIPAEQVYSLVLEAEPDLIDEALDKQVVLAGPLTLYAMLAVIRQAAEQANIMRTADEVIALLGQFHNQWQRYNEQVDKLGRAIDSTSRAYDELKTTRSNMLEKPLEKIEELRRDRGLPDDSES